jgi:uncharacterized protein (TIGR03435 family)
MVITHHELKTLIQLAFGIPHWSISGGKHWTANDEFDVEGKPPASATAHIRDLRHSVFSFR